MKTSNKLIVAAMLLIFIALFIYDEMLKTEYVSGRYRDPYRNYVSLNFKDFDAIDINSSTIANAKIVQGPFSIKIDKDAKEYVNITQKGNKLTVSADFKYSFLNNANPYIVIISCPKLNQLHTSATYTLHNSAVTDTIVGWQMREVLVDGFKLDSLLINQDYGSTILIKNSHINYLSGVVGKANGSGSVIKLFKTNQFESVKLDIQNRSQLEVNNIQIPKLDYHLADSAKLILNGEAGNYLKKP
ncbi:DUF2807 domain-containing protein [Mucilaginibacter sp. X5P1]|uniref:DUF2807 domain-containing protein n=1 Tax=Mucilaginibacter sp. X5P1 TaxID=2723088 RepID=UPI00161CB030|nr:DUF2807 domain-containing protein [Mucilaginibacter sp. X5P1]MBB6138607.1 hypothetical protein [Mucilaginibacter sp. X5P1]